MDSSGVPHDKSHPLRSHVPTWRAGAKSAGTSDATNERKGKASGIRPPQVRTNPRVTRQGLRSKNDSESSGDSQLVTSPTDLDISGIDLNLSPLSPSSSLTRRGAFRYGRGIKPLHVHNLGSGAATLPRMRPKGSGTARQNLDIFTKPEIESSAPETSKEQILKDPVSTSSRRTSQRSKSVYGLGRTYDAKQVIQERNDASKKSEKAQDPLPTGDKTSKGTNKVRTNISKGPESSKVQKKSPEGLKGHVDMNSNSSNNKGSSHPKTVSRQVDTGAPNFKTSVSPPKDHASRPAAKVDCLTEHKVTKHSNTNSCSRDDKGKITSKSVPLHRRNRSVDEAEQSNVEAEQSNVEMTPKVPPRRQHALPKPTNSSPSSSLTKFLKPSRESSRSRERLNVQDTPKPPPRRPKQQPLTRRSESPKAIPTLKSKTHSGIGQDRSKSGSPSQISPKPLPAMVKVHLSSKGSSSYPLGSTVSSMRDTSMRSHSVSNIPVPASSKKSSIPRPHRQVKLRQKGSKSETHNPVFRLSLDGGDSGTENSSSLATTPSECSIDVDFSFDEASPVCRLTPAKFYSISGMEDHIVSSSENSEKDLFQDTLETEPEVIKVTNHPQTWSMKDKTSPQKPVTVKDTEDDEPTTPKNKTFTSTSEFKSPKSVTLSSESYLSELVYSPKAEQFHHLKPVGQTFSDGNLNLVNSATAADSIKSGNITNPENVAKSIDDTINHAKFHEVSSKTSQDITRSIKAIKRDLLASSRSYEQNGNQSTWKKSPQHPTDSSKSTGFIQSKIGHEIAIRVARGDLKASSVDGEGEAIHSSIKEDPRCITAPHKVSSSKPRDGTEYGTKSAVTVKTSGVEASADFNQKSSKPRRRISSIKSPHDVQSNSKDHLRDQRNAESGLSALEKMMDAGEGTLKPNHKKNSFHPYTKENSGTEGKYLRSCSDPMKLLEFLMNIDEPPKVGGYDGDMKGTTVVKRRRAISDILGPGQRVVHKDGGLNRWSMPAMLEQWSHNFRSHLTNNGRSRQKSRSNEINAVPVKTVAPVFSDKSLSSTSGTSNVKPAMKLPQRKLYGVSGDGSRRFLSSLKRTKDVLQDDSQCNKPKMRHRWSVPVAPYSILQSIIDTEGTQTKEEKLPSSEDQETDEGGQLLKRKSRWRWSLPLLRSSRSSTDLKDLKLQSKDDYKVSSRSLKTSPSAPDLKIEPDSPEHLDTKKQALSFSDITDNNLSSPNTVKVFVDSTFAEQQNNDFHCSSLTKVTSTSSPHLNTSNFLSISSDDDPSPASLKVNTSTDASGLSAILRDPGSRYSGKKNSKKRLSWKREKSLENVCYLESFEMTEFEDEGILAEEESDLSLPLSPHTPPGIILPHQPKNQTNNNEDGVEGSNSLTKPKENSTRIKTAPVSTFSPWVLPSDELKSKLESVYAERQQTEHENENDIWKLNPNPQSTQSYSSSLDSDQGVLPRGTVYQPSDSTMRESAMTTGIGKRFSLKQQLSTDSDPDLSRQYSDSTCLQSRDNINEIHSGSRSPGYLSDGTPINNNVSSRPKLSRPRSASGSGTESLKDTRRKLDDVSHKTKLRIERDREGKTSSRPSSTEISDPSELIIPQRKLRPGLAQLFGNLENGVPDEPTLDGGDVKLSEKDDKNSEVVLGQSLLAFRRRKKSMAIALSEGRLDLLSSESPISPSPKSSELNLVSQIGQLNQELKQLTQTPPGTPPTPCYIPRGGLQRSGSRGSLVSLPGSNKSPRPSFPTLSLWKSVSQFQTTFDDYPKSETPKKDKSDGEIKRVTPLKSLPKDEEEAKEGKIVSPKVLLSRIKHWSKKKGQTKPKPRPEIIKIDPVRMPSYGSTTDDEDECLTPTTPVPLLDTTNIPYHSPELPHLITLRSVPLSRDTTLRKTWHGMPFKNSEEGALGENHEGVTKFQRCNSLRAPIRQRKKGLSPMENAHLVAMQLSAETIPGSSVDSGIVKDRAAEEASLAGDSDTGSHLCSPCSSLGSSNPPSRPLSSDIGDLQWEKALGDHQGGFNDGFLDERKLSAVTIGRRESATGVSRVRGPMSTRLSLGSQSAYETSDSILSPKKVTFSLAEDITKKAMEADLKRLPKPNHLPRRSKTDMGDIKAITNAIKEFEEEASSDASCQTKPAFRRRALSDLSSIIEKEKTKDENPKQPSIVITPDTSKTTNMMRTRSIPDHMSRMEGPGHQPPPRKNSLADLIGSEVGEVLTSFGSQYNFEAYSPDTMPTFAEALWDHVTMDESELAFNSGDVIEVTDMRDKNWWWGCRGEVEGWVPAQFVRLRVSQGETVEECVERLKEEREQSKRIPLSKKNRKVSLSFLSNDQVRAKVVEEIITTERDYVHHLKDVCEGYIGQASDRPEMFSDKVMNSLFGNIEEIYSFQKGFLLQLEASINQDRADLSRIGGCFLDHKNGFETYSEYCNNYPRALRELKLLKEKQKYRQFFEACRLLQNMIEISLDGFLLTPVQKICKYPLQLRELLKYTRPQHADYLELQDALEVMKDVAVSINDRKRRIENIEKIAAWQKMIGDWEGEDILEKSTQLIHSGDIIVLAGKRTTGRRLFLFDHQLVVCKKDWKGALLYKRKINLDMSNVSDKSDGKDSHWNVTVKHAFTIHNTETNKLHTLSCKGEDEKQLWLKMFNKEREMVLEDQQRGFSIPSSTREAAMKNVGEQQPGKPQDASVVTRKVSTMPYAYQHKILKTPNKSIDLPRGISSSDVFKKKGKGLFGIGKK
ncbi:uncharacterized protein LOC117298938 [Asterias rubens]|uniref:uncharacterized protein LOC117298938 n=1 Tax=Asterias rubens TaxID=7604 RepID=UPI001455CBAB|nr:uncharacterized protein LOC117298938 [Asterias rubens]XP_033638214.1 uncharacterized protein LOC117298938 [Asterias rubens]XP_033638215.1 uncharacterized protein LOC117298938 [Asterias rubens]